jgi:type II secretory pathway pseudopilin PulG
MPMRARSGVSLFEAVAALTIVGMTAVSALSAVGSEMRAAERARRAIEVEALATQRLDYTALLSDRELQNLPDSVAKGTFAEPLTGYRWVTTAGPVSGESGLYDVRVRINWTGGSYTLRTYVFRRPPTVNTR